MSPRVTFYDLKGKRRSDSLVCQLVNKAWQQGLRVLIKVHDEVTARSLDQSLWTFSDISFLPHALASEPDSKEIPILITWQDIPNPHNDVLINLTLSIPDNADNFSRIIEVVDVEDESRRAARQRYRDYRERGYDLEKHNIE